MGPVWRAKRYPYNQVRQRWSVRREAPWLGDLHHQQTADHRDVAETVGEKAPTLADLGYEDPSNRGADDSRAIEHGRVQRNGVHQIFLAHHVDQKGLPRGNVESVHHSQQCRQHEDVPHPDNSGEGKRGKDQRQNHGRNLSADYDPLAIEPVSYNAAQRRHQEYGNLAGETSGAQQQRGAGHAVNQP
jgi:hypothetical protein